MLAHVHGTQVGALAGLASFTLPPKQRHFPAAQAELACVQDVGRALPFPSARLYSA